MPTKRDVAVLLGWERMAGPPMVRIADDRWRPAGIDAWFLVGNLLVSLNAEGTARDVLVRYWQARRLSDREAKGLRPGCWAALRRYENTGLIALSAEETAAVDVAALLAVLRTEAVVTYDRDAAGRVVAVGYGSALSMPAEMVRRDLAGPEGPPKPGPKQKADTRTIRELYRETGDVKSVALALGLSTATVYRHLNTKEK